MGKSTISMAIFNRLQPASCNDAPSSRQGARSKSAVGSIQDTYPPRSWKKTVDIRGSPDRKDRFFYGYTINVY